jgi:hypothetical protein
LRLSINHPEAAVYIHQPTFETTVAVQITANALWRKGDPGSFARGELGGICVSDCVRVAIF